MNQTKEWLKFRKSQFANVSHIRACQKVFIEHIATCERCLDHLTAYNCGLCDVGQAAFDEIAAAIIANPSCEHLTAKEPEEFKNA